jgi:ABC-type multidrug transport system ATPase subunit
LAVFAAFTMVGALAAVNLSASGASTKTVKPVVATSSPGSQWTVKHPFKAAFIYVGAPSDAGWTHAQDVGCQDVQKSFGGRVETMYKEDVPEGPQCSAVITQLVDAGANIVFATSYGYQSELLAASQKYPKVLFEQATGTDVTKTLSEYYGAGEDGDFLGGMAAGAASKTGKIGFVAPYAIPEVLREVDAFTMDAVVIELDDVCARGDLGTQALKDVTLDVRAGEILGIAGVAGNGQLELAEVITGLRPATKGKITVGGKRLPAGNPRAAIDLGIAYVPEDRMGTGISPNLSIAENLILKSYRAKAFRSGPVLSARKANANAKKLIELFDVRAPGPRTLIRQLSGGNIQKVLLARELSSEPRVLVAASPTRGLDVGATQDVRRMLADTAKRGVAVLMISEDLDEILELADRIAVFFEGRLVGILPSAGVSRQQIGLMMAGAS